VEEHAKRLRQERERNGWSQTEVAEKIGTTFSNVSRWERGITFPGPYFRQKLCELYKKSAEELGLVGHQAEPIWNIPYLRNLFFTGREETLTLLHYALNTQKTVAPTQPFAISGLGGIGKTQTALEYVYRYADEYEAALWTRADSYESLFNDFIGLAGAMDLPKKDEANQNLVVEAVRNWLKGHKRWLLIFDNADDIEMVSEFLPTRGAGHILLTTRSQATGPHIKGIELEKMTREEGTSLLLRRAKIIAEDADLNSALDADRVEAEAICELLDGLPLALDQAGAYIEEKRCTLSDYRKLYQTERADLLNRRSAYGKKDYPKSAATTWSLSFEQVKQANASAANLLELCAFLNPDAIAEDMIKAAAHDLGPELQAIADRPLLLDDAIGELRKYSLMRRNMKAKTLTIHRLVQAVLKDTMDKKTQRQWAERAVRVVSRTFPDAEFTHWERCQQLLSQAQACADLIKDYKFSFPEALRLLNQAGIYLGERGQYDQAALLLQQAVSICEEHFGAEHSDVAEILEALGATYYYQGKYAEAEQIFQRLLDIYEKAKKSGEPKLVETLNNLAALYNDQGKYAQAEPLLQRALSISKEILALEDPATTGVMNNLGFLYYLQGRYDEAEPLYQQVLAIREETREADHPELIISLNNLAALFRAQGKYTEAEPLFQRTLASREKTLGPQHPDLATSLNNLATVYHHLSKYTEAEQLIKRALTIREQALGAEHSDVSNSLNALGQLYYDLRKYAEAEDCFTKALTIRQKVRGPEHPDVAQSLNDLGLLYCEQKLYEQAEQLLKRALAIREKTLGEEHPDTASSRASYADLLRKMNE
jgi:tetratricopeptide (TPR) repeat protein